ncbi:MAG: hypothetical protein ACHQFW_05770 [Chitinophagales bacterium]
MKKILLLLIIFCSGSLMISYSQVVADGPLKLDKPNIIKFNLTGPIVGYYTLGYERVINFKQSTGVTFSIAPNMDLPFKNTLLNIYGDNADAVEAINSTTFTSFSMMPEYRFYSSPTGAPFGFYFATYLKYTHMTHSGIYRFTTSDGTVHTPTIETSFNGFGVGEMIGIQWKLGQSLTLDFNIIGPFIGFMKGNSHGVDPLGIEEDERAKLEADIEGTPIPGWNIDATVGANDVDADLGGLFLGTRIFGVNLGYRF